MPAPLVPLLALLAGCNFDNALSGKDESPPGFDGDTASGPPVDTATTAVGEEECNGLDDDGDGAIDEGFPDDDGNGRADCEDAACPALSLGVAESVAIVDACVAGPTALPVPVADPWHARVKWAIPNVGQAGSFTTPVIGNLTDDNGDGSIDGNDIPEVVYVASDGELTALDGATGTVEWQSPNCGTLIGAAIGDIDGDGAPDIVAMSRWNYVVAFEGDGTLKWTSAEPGGGPFTIADLDGDGNPEVLADLLVLDGATGATEFLIPPRGLNYRSTAVADLDLDGDQEIFLGGALYDSDGTVIWDTGEEFGDWPLLVQADADPEGEIAVVTTDQMGIDFVTTFTVYDTDGTVLAQAAPVIAGGGSVTLPGPPCAGDFDGDGWMEVAAPLYLLGPFIEWELDGSVAWQNLTSYPTYGSGCSGFDFDGDGALEIIYAGDEALDIYDGTTGDTLYTDTDHKSATVVEFATVADVDHDDHADLVFVGNNAAVNALTVLEHDGPGWAPAGPIWANNDFYVTNVGTDGSVPRAPEPSWQRYKVYRARTAVESPPGLPDLLVSITDVCVMDCTYGPVEVGVQVTNQGEVDVPAGTLLSLYADDDSGRRLVATLTLPSLPAGYRAEGSAISLGAEDIGTHGFIAVVDDAGGVEECDEENNEARWTDVFCP
jgi:hypothetical protein